MRTSCPRCRAPLGSALVCEACKQLLEPAVEAGPFEILGVEPTFALHPEELRKRLLALSRLVHPDYFGAAAEGLRQQAEQASAALNAAYRVLSDDFRRADHLIRTLGGPGEDQERTMPPAFLQQVLEWNETIEEGRAASADSAPRRALESLGTELRSERERLFSELRALLSPLPASGAPALTSARRLLNAIRYLDRALGEIAEVRLSPSAHR